MMMFVGEVQELVAAEAPEECGVVVVVISETESRLVQELQTDCVGEEQSTRAKC